MNPILNSDKHYWHGFAGFYEANLPESLDGEIIEIGILNGDSVRWLADKYPTAKIVGADIQTANSRWPQGDNFSYEWLDQSDPRSVAAVFKKHPGPALILEDGSHQPAHQSLCLKLGLRALRPGGIYILEDIHTSFPQHPMYHEEFNKQGKNGKQQTALTVLLAFEHIKRLGRHELGPDEALQLGIGEHFNEKEVRDMFAWVDKVIFYKRPHLPERCYCGSSDYDYHNMRCSCGKWLMLQAESVSAMIFKKY